MKTEMRVSDAFKKDAVMQVVERGLALQFLDVFAAVRLIFATLH